MSHAQVGCKYVCTLCSARVWISHRHFCMLRRGALLGGDYVPSCGGGYMKGPGTRSRNGYCVNNDGEKGWRELVVVRIWFVRRCGWQLWGPPPKKYEGGK